MSVTHPAEKLIDAIIAMYLAQRAKSERRVFLGPFDDDSEHGSLRRPPLASRFEGTKDQVGG